MGGQNKAADQLKRNAQMTQAQTARQNKKANRIAVRTATQERKQSARQNQQLIAAEKQSAALLAQVGQDTNLRTDVITDEEAARKKLMAMGGRSAYGFGRPAMSGLGGGSSTLG